MTTDPHAPQHNWYTEFFSAEGSSFGLEINSMLHEEQSQYQKIQVFDTQHFGKLLVLDDCIMLTERDHFIYHEMMSHAPLLSHPNPADVVIIGGGDCGVLYETLKHPQVQHVIQIEIDPRVTEVSQQYFPELCSQNHDPRATLKFIDGIDWLNRQSPASFDLIIVDSTDPVGPAKGLFTEAFFSACFSALKPNGMLVQQSESPLYHSQSIMKDMKHDMLKCGFSNVIHRLFAQPVYPSGWWSSTSGIKPNTDGEVLDHDLKRTKNFATRYYNEGIHSASMVLPEFMRS